MYIVQIVAYTLHLRSSTLNRAGLIAPGYTVRSTALRWVTSNNDSQGGVSCLVEATYWKMNSMQGEAIVED